MGVLCAYRSTYTCVGGLHTFTHLSYLTRDRSFCAILTCADCQIVSVVASQNSLGSIDGDVDVDAEEPDEDDQNRCILCEKCFPDIEQ